MNKLWVVQIWSEWTEDGSECTEDWVDVAYHTKQEIAVEEQEIEEYKNGHIARVDVMS